MNQIYDHSVQKRDGTITVYHFYDCCQPLSVPAPDHTHSGTFTYWFRINTGEWHAADNTERVLQLAKKSGSVSEFIKFMRAWFPKSME